MRIISLPSAKLDHLNREVVTFSLLTYVCMVMYLIKVDHVRTQISDRVYFLYIFIGRESDDIQRE